MNEAIVLGLNLAIVIAMLVAGGIYQARYFERIYEQE